MGIIFPLFRLIFLVDPNELYSFLYLLIFDDDATYRGFTSVYNFSYLAIRFSFFSFPFHTFSDSFLNIIPRSFTLPLMKRQLDKNGLVWYRCLHFRLKYIKTINNVSANSNTLLL